jgi:hypothetical protein
MATMFCPGCGKSISAEEKAKGFCPGCGKPLSGSPKAAAPPPRPAPRPRPETTRIEEEAPGVTPSVLGWGTVRAGLAQTVVGSLLLAFSGLVMYVIRITALDGHGTNMLIVVIAALCGVGTLAGFVAAVSGAFMGCAAPSESGARGWAVACTVLLTLFITLLAVVFIAYRESEYALQGDIALGPRLHSTAPAWQPNELQVVRYLMFASLPLAQLCYLLFLRAVASFFQRDALALGVVCYLAFNLLFTTGLVLLFSGVLDLGSLPIQGEGLAYLFIAVVVTLGVWGVVLVGQVRGAVTRGILKS